MPAATAFDQKRTRALFRMRRSRLIDRPASLLAIGLSFLLCMLPGCLSRSLTGLQITPAAGSVTIGPGQTSQFQAVGVFTESGHATTGQNLTAKVTWQSSSNAIATISSSGLATGVSAGTATITASMNGQFGPVSATSTVTVTATGGVTSRTLTSLSVTPASQTVATVGQIAQFIAVGTYSSGSPLTQNLTTSVSWQSSDPLIAQVSSTGLATSTGVGQATITALATGPDGSVVSASSTIIVTSGSGARTLTSLVVSPASQTVATVGQTAQFLALATYSSGSPATQNLTNSATWQSSAPSVATVNSSGLVTTTGAGQATISALATASDGSVVSANATIAVTSAAVPRVLTSLVVIPNSQTVATAGQTSQFIAIGTYSSGSPSTQDLTDSVTWQSSGPQVAVVNSAGLATGVAAGQATISALATASDGTVTTANGTIAVTNTPLPRTLSSLVVIPSTQPVSTVGETVQFTAIGTYNTGNPATEDVTRSALWQSSDTNVALVNASGLATTIGSGQATVTAVATSADGSVTSASGVLTSSNPTPVGTGTVLPVLTTQKVGSGTGTVSATANGNVVITCSANQNNCTGNFPVNQAVVLTAVAAAGSQFDGWSVPCSPNPATAASCTFTITSNETIVAIFDPIVTP
jgi:uncharacterized protein YjdB